MINRVSHATIINYFTIFLQNVNVANFKWFLLKPTTNITSIFINNHSPQQ